MRMLGKQPHWWKLVGSAGLSLLLFGCIPSVAVGPGGNAQSTTTQTARDDSQRVAQARPTEVRPAVATPTAVAKPTVAATTGVPSPRTVGVRRGAITETAQLTGRVAGTQEASLSFPARSGVINVPVSPGQAVTEGQILVETDSKAINASLAEVRARVETGSVQLDLGQKQAQTRRQSAITDAEDALKRAQADYVRLEAGPAKSDRLAAEAAVVTARASLERAQADLERIKAGAKEVERRAATQEVTANRLALRAAEEERDRVKAGADPAARRSAENDVTKAKSAVATAQADLDELTGGPNPYDRRAAEREVERAQAALKAAEAAAAAKTAEATPADTPGARAAAVSTAVLGVQEAKDRLARLLEPPRPDSVLQARGKLAIAKSDLTGAEERLAKLLKADQLTIDKSEAAVAAAKTALAKSEGQLADLETGASPADTKAAERVVETNRLGLDNAEARLEELTSHPTPAELEAGQQRVAVAQSALDRVRSASSDSATDSTAVDLALLKKNLERDRAQIKSLETDLEATRLRAPFTGTVVAVPAQPGDTVEAGRPAVVIAREGDPVIVATIASMDDRALPRMSVGQKARVQIDGGDGTLLEGTVARLADAVTGMGRQAQFKVAWGTSLPPFGATAQVDVELQEKLGALLVPMSAIRSAGPRKYVEYMDGASRQIADVEVGITTAADAEILSGLQEGQLVLAAAGPPVTGSTPASPPLATGMTPASPPLATNR